jgi:hypothetical protein
MPTCGNAFTSYQDRHVLAGRVRLPPGTLAAMRYPVGRLQEAK